MTKEIYICDMCHKEVERNNLYKNIPLPGECLSDILFVKKDICNVCLVKATNLMCFFDGKDYDLKFKKEIV